MKAIDVNVWTLGNKNGSAGDAIVNYHRPSDPPEGVEVLTIDLSAKLPPRNLSPAHELFHQFQNGYSQFKNAWYYEGMARWSEDLFRSGAGAADALPASGTELEALFARSYDASRTWQALARATDPEGRVRLPPALCETRYLGSPKPRRGARCNLCAARRRSGTLTNSASARAAAARARVRRCGSHFTATWRMRRAAIPFRANPRGTDMTVVLSGLAAMDVLIVGGRETARAGSASISLRGTL